MLKRKKLSENMPADEAIEIGILLALVGGFLDAYTYILHGGVFANAQTGNLVLVAMNIAEKNFFKSLYCLFPILAFFSGILITEYIKNHSTLHEEIEWTHIVIIIEIITLSIVAFLPLTLPNGLINLIISFVCSLQVNSFRKTQGMPYATTMCTGNLRSAGEHFHKYMHTKDKEFIKNSIVYFIIILSFCLGAFISTILIPIFKEKSIISCCITLSIVLIIMITRQPSSK